MQHATATLREGKLYAIRYMHIYGSLYVTLCFVLCRFDFGVLTFYFRILSFLFCVLCSMLFFLNGAVHEADTIYRRKDGRKRSCKYFKAFIVHVMLVGVLDLKSMQQVTITESNVQGKLQVGSLSVKAFK